MALNISVHRNRERENECVFVCVSNVSHGINIHSTLLSFIDDGNGNARLKRIHKNGIVAVDAACDFFVILKAFRAFRIAMISLFKTIQSLNQLQCDAFFFTEGLVRWCSLFFLCV